MQDLKINFGFSWAPWLFLLLIPALAITLYFYFRTDKRFRRTRNRVISVILHMLVTFFALCTLTGMTFSYKVTNLENEIILLVDVSDTQQEVEDRRDSFVRSIIEECSYDGFRLGVVTFGFDQNYAVPFTYDIDTVYDTYMSASLPDTSATDIADALRYTGTLFTNLETSKIILVTDGKETDEAADSVIRALAARGTIIDVVNVPSDFENDTLQVKKVEYPNYHVNVNEKCSLGVVLNSLTAQTATIELFDNGESMGEVKTVQVPEGEQRISFDVTFATQGLHEIEVRTSSTEDHLTKNNRFYSYYYLEEFNNILILEQFENQSLMLKGLLSQNGQNDDIEYNVKVLNLQKEKDADYFPKTVDELRVYDQIIMNNVANADLPEGFDALLNSYVYDCGGGLFTVGGNDEEGEAHAYNRADMVNTLYQQMLPVQAINYTPPVGVVVIVDISGSMAGQGSGGLTLKEWAIQGAVACLDALTERDFIGVMTLDTVYGTVLPMTSCTQRTVIKEKIESINSMPGGATNFTNALDRAGQALVLSNVDKRHVILVSDGFAGDRDTDYIPIVDNYYNNNGITFSTVGINMTEGSDSSGERVLTNIAEHGHGRTYFISGNYETIVPQMREDLNVPEIKEVNNEPFNPYVNDETSTLLDGVNYGESVGMTNRNAMSAKLGGFYGVKERASADVVLIGEFEVPIYAQWKYGIGTVGSFMCDLNGNWSSEFIENPNGQRFLLNVIKKLMPTKSLRVSNITIDLYEDNYINQLNIYNREPLQDGETIRARIEQYGAENNSVSLNEVSPDKKGEIFVSENLTAANKYSRCKFIIKKSGVYSIIIEKLDASGEVKDTFLTYKSFAYSEEYAPLEEKKRPPEVFLQDIAAAGGGILISDETDSNLLLKSFNTSLDRVFDPRWLFMALAMVLFLLDIVVRKFKFKWIHELIREHKQKKMMEEPHKGGNL